MAQENPVQWTGFVRDESLQPLSFVHIGIEGTNKGTLSDREGKFTLLAHPDDTLRFSCVGFKTLRLEIPETESRVVLYDVIMEEDTIQLEEVIVLPWKTYQQFLDAFVELTLAKDEIQRAYKNLEMLGWQIYRSMSEQFNAPATPYAAFRFSMQEKIDEISREGEIVPYYPITNPMAWAELVEAIRRGDFKKKD